MGIINGTMAKGTSDNGDNLDIDRMQYLTNKLRDGNISDTERAELATMQRSQGEQAPM